MAQNRDAIFLALSVIFVILLCDLSTPFVYKHVETDRSRTTIILTKLQDPNFRPDVVVFGSSLSMSGIDAYQMTNELGLDCYNFSSTGQTQEESSLYYTLLPNSVKEVVQVINIPVRDLANDDVDTSEKKHLNSAIVSSFVLGGYKISQEAKDINKMIDLSDFDKCKYLISIDARASILIPAITQKLVPRDKSALEDLKFPNGQLTNKHGMYNRTVKQLEGLSCYGKEIELDTKALQLLNEYAEYFRSKGVNYNVVLMPINPDSKIYTKDQCEWISQQIREKVTMARVIDFLNLPLTSDLFYDGGHLNRDGAKIVTGLLNKELKEFSRAF